MKISPWTAGLVFLLAFAAFTRLFLLGTAPAGLTWDEAALGYVGKMVVTTGRDEHGQLLPRAFTSFGDYKAPLAIYITGIFTSLLGLSPLAVRLPFALAGVASVWLMTQIGRKVFDNRWYGLLCGWLLAITPWHLLFSRVAFESGLALFFFLLFLWSWLESRSRGKFEWRWGIIGGIGLLGALYTYHSAKIAVPLSLALILWHEWRQNRDWLRRSIRQLLITAGAIGLFLLPLIHSFVFDKASGRAQQTLIFFQEGSLGEKFSAVISGFATHLSLQFLVFGQTDTLRHGTGMWGVLSFSQMILLLLGVSYLLGRWLDTVTSGRSLFFLRWIQQLTRRPSSEIRIAPWLWLGLAIIGLLPAALGFELPHANRALLALPAFIFLMAYAVKELHHDLPNLLFPSLVGMLVLIASLEFGRFWLFYHGPYRTRSSADWLQGYAEAVSLADLYRVQGKSVKFTSQYGQPEIFFAFALDIPPQEYRDQRVRGVEFGPITPADTGKYDVVIAAPNEALPQVPNIVVEHLDRSPAFLIYEKR